MAANWVEIDGGSEVETKQETDTEAGKVYIYRRKVLVRVYESITDEPAFVFSDETQIYGSEELTRCTSHKYSIDTITKAVTQTKVVTTPGLWTLAHTYDIEATLV